MVIFALHSSDLEQNCFWLLVGKFRHCMQNWTQVYVARFRRKQLFRKYSTLHIDVGFWPIFFCFRWKLLGRGVDFAINLPEKHFWDKNWFESSFIWKANFNPRAKSLRTFWRHIFCGLFESSFYMSRRSLWGKNCFSRNFSWVTVFGVC